VTTRRAFGLAAYRYRFDGAYFYSRGLVHDKALARWSNPGVATRSQYWMLLVMVAFTCLGLWFLSAAAS
jgi:hypothetical protein